MTTENDMQEADHVLIKRGLYYRPNGNGYTGLKSEAGLYRASYALGLDGVEAVPFADAPEFAPACWEETKLAYMRDLLATARAERETLEAEVARLREALADPNAVHVNLLRGDIARPAVHQMIHIYSPAKVRDGLETYARAALTKDASHD